VTRPSLRSPGRPNGGHEWDVHECVRGREVSTLKIRRALIALVMGLLIGGGIAACSPASTTPGTTVPTESTVPSSSAAPSETLPASSSTAP